MPSRRITRRRLIVALWLVVAALLVLVLVGVARGGTAHPRACTHGVSSIGPVSIVNGVASPQPRPHTEACLR